MDPAAPAPAAATGGLTSDDVKKIVAAVVGEAIKPLADNQRVLADTLAKLPPAAGAQSQAAGTPPPALTAEQVTKLVTEAIAADRTAQRQTEQKTAAIAAKKAAVLKAKLGGNEKFAAVLPDTDDEAALNAAADVIAAELKAARPDFGGTSDGGTPAGRQPLDTSKLDPVDRIARGLATTAPTQK